MSTNGSSPKLIRPSKLAHVVLKTNKFDRMKQFYLNFLGGREVYVNDFICFITYDEEHHRIAIINQQGTTDKVHGSAGLVHIAYTWDSLADLCTAYKQRKGMGITPGWCVNHGPTTSMYYQDPDGNALEWQVDNMTPDEATEYMEGPLYAKNIFGADFDPQDLCAAIDRGESEVELKKPKDIGPIGEEKGVEIEERIKRATTGV